MLSVALVTLTAGVPCRIAMRRIRLHSSGGSAAWAAIPCCLPLGTQRSFEAAEDESDTAATTGGLRGVSSWPSAKH